MRFFKKLAFSWWRARVWLGGKALEGLVVGSVQSRAEDGVCTGLLVPVCSVLLCSGSE